MPETPPTIGKPKKKRRWLRRLGWSFLGLVLLILVFLGPLVHVGGRWIAIRLARSHHLDLDLKIEGNVWTRLEIRDVRAAKNASGPAPLERLTLDHLVAEYDLWKLIRGDLTGLTAVDVGSVDAVITP